MTFPLYDTSNYVFHQISSSLQQIIFFNNLYNLNINPVYIIQLPINTDLPFPYTSSHIVV